MSDKTKKPDESTPCPLADDRDPLLARIRHVQAPVDDGEPQRFVQPFGDARHAGRRAAIQGRGMAEDWSWDAPAAEHIALYRELAGT